MLNTVTSALVDFLNMAGIRAVCQYPSSPLESKDGPIVAVGVKSSKLLTSGAGEYLGIRTDAGGGSISETYGFRLELVLGLDIFSPFGHEQGGAGCIQCFGEISGVINQMPSGIKVRGLVCGVTEPDHASEMFHCPCELHCTAYLLSEPNEDTGEFSDFELKGRLANVN